MALKHLNRIAEFFKNAKGEENGILRREIKEFLKKLYNLECNCDNCLFDEFQRDLRKLRNFGSYIYSSKHQYQTIKQDIKGNPLPPEKWYKKLIRQKPKKYYHLNSPDEFQEIIEKLDALANGFNKRSEDLDNEKELIVAKEKIKAKEKQLKKLLVSKNANKRNKNK